MSKQADSRQVVGIGASAGGLTAFKTFFASMPPQTGMAFVLIQHLDPEHPSLLADLLAEHVSLPVVEIEQPVRLESNHVYCIPSGAYLGIEDDQLFLVEPTQPRGLQGPIDYFFRSLAADQKENAIGIILTGTGYDGAVGLKEIKSVGGIVIVQDPVTAEHKGMPTNAIGTGAVDYILPVERMAKALTHHANKELKASNEEALSANEELQAVNEELEASREELQSLNEELTTLNRQLEEKRVELKEAEQSLREKQLSLIINSVPALISYVDLDHCYQFNNKAYERWFGLSLEDLKGKHLAQVLGPGAYEALRPEIERALAGEKVTFERYLPYSKGSNRWVRVTYIPDISSDRKVRGCFALIYDMTEAKKAEEERERLLAELGTANQSLAETARQKDQYLAMLAHELRNPLAVISNVLAVMERSSDESKNEEMHYVLKRNTRLLARLIDDLLDISRIRRGKIQLQKKPVDVHSIVCQSVQDLAALFEEKKHQLKVSVPEQAVWVEADPGRLSQIIINLLSNATKYTPSGGEIAVTVTARHDKVTISVRDSGIGIAKEMQERIFDLFGQVDNSLNRSNGGLGLGLVLVKSLTEMHGGKVWVESEGEGYGAEFTLALPRLALDLPAPLREASPPGSNMHAEPASKPRVLIVDDHRWIADSLAQLLEADDFETTVAYDGPSALQMALNFRPQFALLDIGLPGIDGYELVKQLRGQGLTSCVFIAITGYGEESAKRRSTEAGFSYHLVKPVEAEQLVALLQQQLA